MRHAVKVQWEQNANRCPRESFPRGSRDSIEVRAQGTLIEELWAELPHSALVLFKSSEEDGVICSDLFEQ